MISLELIIIFFLGLSFGSFANVCSLRLPLDKSILFNSHCPICASSIKPYDNIPLISYFLLKGVSRCCKKKISLQYPIIELVSALLLILIFLKFGIHFETIFLFAFLLCLLIIFVSDLKFFIIPNEITYFLVMLGIISIIFDFNPFKTGVYESLIAGSFAFFTFFLISKLFLYIKKKEGLGFGDVKIIGAIGIWLGIEATLIVIIYSSLLGILVGTAMIMSRKIEKGDYLPYGCFITASVFIVTYQTIWLNFNLFNFILESI